jgi:hypothetical protein
VFEKKPKERAPEPLRETGNGPSVSYEPELLEQFYGKPNADGVYGAPEVEVDDERA